MSTTMSLLLPVRLLYPSLLTLKIDGRYRRNGSANGKSAGGFLMLNQFKRLKTWWRLLYLHGVAKLYLCCFLFGSIQRTARLCI